MDEMAAMFVEGVRRARWGEAFDVDAGAGEWQECADTMLGTPPGPGGRGFGGAKAGSKSRIKHQQIAFTSRGASICRRRGRPFGKKIIGRAMSIFRESFHSGSVLVRLLGTFPLLHEPARQHGGGVFLHPKVEKRADLLAEIGGMAEPGEFVALQ